MEVQMLAGSKPATMRTGHLQNLHGIPCTHIQKFRRRENGREVGSVSSLLEFKEHLPSEQSQAQRRVT